MNYIKSSTISKRFSPLLPVCLVKVEVETEQIVVSSVTVFLL